MNKKGFTLVEVVAAIVILSLVTIIATTRGFGLFDNAKKNINDYDESTIKEAAKVYMTGVLYCNEDLEEAEDLSKVVSLDSNDCKYLKEYFSTPQEITLKQLKDNGYITGSNLKNFSDDYSLLVWIENNEVKIQTFDLENNDSEVDLDLAVLSNDSLRYIKNKYSDLITEIHFVDYIDGESNETWNVSRTKKEIIAWFENDDKLYIGSNYRIYAPIISNSLFCEYPNLKTITFNNFDTSKVTSMSAMFYNNPKLETIDLSNFDTKNVKNMAMMFALNSSLISLDLSNFDTSNVTNMSRMFDGLSSLTSLDLSNFDTKNVENMQIMFSDDRSLTSLNVSSFNTSKVTNMFSMFSGLSSLTSLDLSNFDTSNVTNMYGMFYHSKGLNSLDITNFNTSKVKNMWGLFYYDINLETIYASDSFIISDNANSKEIFKGCIKLKGGNNTSYNKVHSDSEYARIDGKDGKPGYFTRK